MATAPEPTPRKQYRKYFIPLESNPDVFTELIHELGVSPTLCFQDVLSLDDEELLTFVPRPALALVLLFSSSSTYETHVAADEAARQGYTGSGDDEDVIWFKQTIYNACGLYGILHAVCNGDARKHIAPNSTLSNLLAKGVPLEPEARGRVLEASAELESAYRVVAQKGDTEPPENPEDVVDFHYVCFVKSHENNRLYELDGDKKGPIDRGAINEDQDMLSQAALEPIREYIDRENGRSINFSLIALVPAG
ncbi:ubiquitin carboxyl-terminal hydrolase [Mytilinidion resinicola]|uniref:Ubiquitin carboxyl-terminal hydrolase n=1 Tax=Mytilinidion resinicola TaxID=574789 RepID=A0A6A6Z875_9PEZI|nr:ubiquitin carboxyl-terminal hydrolase [Mytilinidion resinicola]KAF2817322.1 ubiquitin carboxyl-terminal hydrolase [Mytilinidion resinicola]